MSNVITLYPPDLKLGEFFDLGEFCDSPTAQKHGIFLHPSPAQVESLRLLVFHVLDPLRRLIARPLNVTSGFRTPELNQLIGGAVVSMHLEGKAADVKCSLPARELLKVLTSNGIEVDQAIGYSSNLGGHLHLAWTNTRPNRGEILWSATKKQYRPWSQL